MDAVVYIQHQVEDLRQQTYITLQGLTAEQVNWTPPGTVNPVGVILLHTFGSEDQFVQQRLQGKSLLWESGNWGVRLGVEALPNGELGWEECRRIPFNLSKILEYHKAVCAATDTYLSGLTPADLDLKYMLWGRQQTLADVLVSMLNHSVTHMGEIAALKGIQGMRGLPF